ncbi:MAG: hypothetical protein AMJ88_12540 [Anaerolineae bacterium SM23_ 63]|nr:MAG: hypothetical protein AMJ88_12540 [Anaerolineae bacterium SM23_ 63]
MILGWEGEKRSKFNLCQIFEINVPCEGAEMMPVHRDFFVVEDFLRLIKSLLRHFEELLDIVRAVS